VGALARRYVGVVPADRAFYDAGMAAKAGGLLGNAFVFLNRYLDLREAMEVLLVTLAVLALRSLPSSSPEPYPGPGASPGAYGVHWG
jgi:hypothetical protein